MTKWVEPYNYFSTFSLLCWICVSWTSKYIPSNCSYKIRWLCSSLETKFTNYFTSLCRYLLLLLISFCFPFSQSAPLSGKPPKVDVFMRLRRIFAIRSAVRGMRVATALVKKHPHISLTHPLPNNLTASQKTSVSSRCNCYFLNPYATRLQIYGSTCRVWRICNFDGLRAKDWSVFVSGSINNALSMTQIRDVTSRAINAANNGRLSLEMSRWINKRRIMAAAFSRAASD